MLFGGLQRTTLIDYPGKIACTVFSVGCNFACPFCHNKDLVSEKLFTESGISEVSEKEIFDFLAKRRGILEGVCITGGEPCLNPDLPHFIKKIKNLDYSVKLDTNGSNPEMLKKLIEERLINYVAMDIKTNFSNYEEVIRVKNYESRIKKSIELILKSKIDYEFRTTIVPTLHTKETLLKLAKYLKSLNSQFNWYLQPFRPQNCLDPQFLKIEPYTYNQLKQILKVIKKILPTTKLRGE